MGEIMILELITLHILTSQSFAATSECRGNLTMIVTGVDSDKGQIKFDLDNAADTFRPKENGKPAFANGRSSIKDNRVEYTFKDIPCGEYAIKLYHDANMNQTLDKNFLKIPKEQYGFSNCTGCKAPPRWEKAKFVFDKNHPIITIKL
jgi:uncharacterized protein (DUF2141 family)